MNVTCHNCKTKLNIPDHKIPRNKDTSFKCPKCNKKVHIPAVKELKPEMEVKKQGASLAFEERLNALVSIGDDDLKKKVYPIISRMGFDAVAVTDTKTALNKMEYQIYHLVIADDTFDQNKGITGILERLNALDMSLRRRICLVWISNKFNTNDDMASLHFSVNSVIHKDDLIHFEAFLSRTMMEHKNFYTVYNSSLKLMGKA